MRSWSIFSILAVNWQLYIDLPCIRILKYLQLLIKSWCIEAVAREAMVIYNVQIRAGQKLQWSFYLRFQSLQLKYPAIHLLLPLKWYVNEVCHNSVTLTPTLLHIMEMLGSQCQVHEHTHMVKGVFEGLVI